MKQNPSIQQSLFISSVFVLLLWIIQFSEQLFGLDLGFLGVRPGDWTALSGIITAPLVHGSMQHLYSNTLPLWLLGSVLIYGYPQTRYKALAVIWLISGAGVWLFVRESFHIGASGITHGVFFYLLLSSILRRDKRSIALMMIAFFMYGGMVLSILPQEEHISFEYHFFGAVGGVIATLLFFRREPKPVEKKYEWEQEETQDLSVNEEDPIIGNLWQQPQSDENTENTDKRP